MSERKPILLIEGKEQANAAARRKAGIEKGLRSPVEIITFDAEADYELVKQNVPHQRIQDYNSEYLTPHDSAVKLARSWYRLCGDQDFKEGLVYDGVLLGELTEFNFGQRLMQVFNRLERVLTVINKETPGRVVLVQGSSLFTRTAAFACRNKNIPVTYAPTGISNRVNSLLKAYLQPYREKIGDELWYRRFSAFRKSNGAGRSTHLSSEPGKHSVLLMSNYGVHLDNLYSAAENLPKDSCTVNLLVDVTIPTKLPSQVARVFALRDFRAAMKTERVKQGCRSLKRQWIRLARDGGGLEIEYRGINVWPLLKDEYRDLFLNQLPSLIGTAEAMNLALDTLTPDILVLGDDIHSTMKTAAVTANRKKIPTLTLMHGLPASAFGVIPVTASKIAVPGKTSANFLIANGVPQNKVVITGSPRFDVLVNDKSDINKTQVLAGCSFDGKVEKIILLPTQPFSDETIISWSDNTRTVAAIVKAAGEFPGALLVLKLHPGERIETYQSLTDSATKGKILIVTDDLYKWLRISDVVVTVNSTVGIEAMLLGKPLIQINLTGKDIGLDYTKGGAAIKVESEKQLEQAIRDALYNKDRLAELAQARKQFVFEQVYTPDGEASKRVAGLIMQMVTDYSNGRSFSGKQV